jgi:hypothetical protein
LSKNKSQESKNAYGRQSVIELKPSKRKSDSNGEVSRKSIGSNGELSRKSSGQGNNQYKKEAEVEVVPEKLVQKRQFTFEQFPLK